MEGAGRGATSLAVLKPCCLERHQRSFQHIFEQGNLVVYGTNRSRVKLVVVRDAQSFVVSVSSSLDQAALRIPSPCRPDLCYHICPLKTLGSIETLETSCLSSAAIRERLFGVVAQAMRRGCCYPSVPPYIGRPLATPHQDDLGRGASRPQPPAFIDTPRSQTLDMTGPTGVGTPHVWRFPLGHP